MKIAVVTDSTADLDHDYVVRSNVKVVPSYIVFNLGRYVDDGQSLRAAQVLEGMKQGKGTVSTTPPAVEQYAEAYHEALDWADHVISLHTSAQIAQNIINAQQAAQAFQGLVTVLDSGTTSAAQGMQVKRMVEGNAQGKDLSALMTEQRRLASEGTMNFVVDDLQFLRMNGRIGAAAALIGGALNLKPIIATKQGRLEPVARVMGHRRAMNALVDTVRQYQSARGAFRLAIPYGPGGEEYVRELRLLLTGIPFEDMGDWPLGTAVAANSGPGSVGVALQPA